MASLTRTLGFSFSDGAINATAPLFDALLFDSLSSGDSFPHGLPPTTPLVSVASASECDALGPQITSLLMDYLLESLPHPPMFLGSACNKHTIRRPHVQCLTFFWPHAQYARARVGLPHTSFHMLLEPFCQTLPTTFKPLEQLSSDVDIDALLELAKAAATFSPQYASVVHDLYYITALIEQSNFSTYVRRQNTMIRMVAVSRLDSRDQRVLTEADSLVSLDPTTPSSYLQRAQARCAAKQFWLAILDIWYAVLILNVKPSVESRVIALIARCLPHVPYVGLDVLFVPRQSIVHGSFPAPYKCLIWERLSSEQQKMHNDIVERVLFSKRTVALPLSADKEIVEHASRYTAYTCSPKKTNSFALKLPQMFMWLVPLRLAGSAMPSSNDQVAAVRNAGFTLVVSLTIEKRLQPSWFNESCRNLFLPIRKRGVPSFHQVDMFVAQVAGSRRALIHCMEGKSRTGLFMAVWLMLFGFSSYPSLCATCASLKSLDETNKFIGGCRDAKCALAVRQPEMSPENALRIVRRQRAGMAITHDQEKFLNDYNAELWQRYTILQDLSATANSYEIVYPKLSSISDNSAKLEVIGSALQESPSLIVFCGLPGSGKSFLAKRILNLNRSGFTIACQDSLGSRDSCLSSVSHAARKKGVCPIVDRCNPKLSDREQWLHCAFNPSPSIVVYFDIPPEVCITRAERRIDHPTLVPSSASRVINGVSKTFEKPNEKDVQAGFTAIYVIRGSVSLGTFLNHVKTVYSAGQNRTRKPHNHSEQNENDSVTSSRTNSTNSTERSFALGAMETYAEGSGHREQNMLSSVNCSVSHVIAPSTSERPVRLLGLVKFPRTRHVLDLGGSATNDDLIMDERELAKMITMLKMTELEKSMILTIEEKVDGANLGFSICKKSGKILVQNRSHYVNAKSHIQFKLINYFVNTYEEDLRRVLCGGERILYGEWMYAKHSILYTNLPSVFLAFDLYDKTEKKFLSRLAFRKELNGTRICSVKEVHLPNEITVSTITELALKCKSQYYEGPAEGLYIRVDHDQWLLDRAKIVRPDFIAGNEHWTKRVHERNKFESL